jgi:hypothetical protein
MRNILVDSVCLSYSYCLVVRVKYNSQIAWIVPSIVVKRPLKDIMVIREWRKYGFVTLQKLSYHIVVPARALAKWFRAMQTASSATSARKLKWWRRSNSNKVRNDFLLVTSMPHKYSHETSHVPISYSTQQTCPMMIENSVGPPQTREQ